MDARYINPLKWKKHEKIAGKVIKFAVGRSWVMKKLVKKNDFSDWVLDKKLKALSSEGKIGKEKAFLIEPETFMNKSGFSLQLIENNSKP